MEVIFVVVDSQIWLCLTVQAKWKDDELVSVLMTSSQTKQTFFLCYTMNNEVSVHVCISTLASSSPLPHLKTLIKNLRTWEHLRSFFFCVCIHRHESIKHNLRCSTSYSQHQVCYPGVVRSCGPLSVTDIWEALEDICPDSLMSMWPLVCSLHFCPVFLKCVKSRWKWLYHC